MLFGEQYRQLKDEIAALRAEVDSQLGDASILKADKTSANESQAEFWRQFVTVDLPELTFAEEVKVPLAARGERGLL